MHRAIRLWNLARGFALAFCMIWTILPSELCASMERCAIVNGAADAEDQSSEPSQSESNSPQNDPSLAPRSHPEFSSLPRSLAEALCCMQSEIGCEPRFVRRVAPRLCAANAAALLRAGIENLKTHPAVRARWGLGDLALHAWVYKIETGQFSHFQQMQVSSSRSARRSAQ